jgi:hypothetical protein
MTAQIITHGDVLLRMARRVAVVVCASTGLAWAMSSLLIGADKDTSARIVFLTASLVVALSALLAGVMSYQSGQLLRALTLTRAELWRLSRTDQLTGLLNRRGFDEAAISALESAYGANLPAVALMCDIDRFKQVGRRRISSEESSFPVPAKWPSVAMHVMPIRHDIHGAGRLPSPCRGDGGRCATTADPEAGYRAGRRPSNGVR